MALGEQIRAYRRRAGMSQEKVAEQLGVSRQAVTKWETDQSAPSMENLFRLAELFGITVEALVNPEREAKPSPAEEFYALCRQAEEAKQADRLRRIRENGQEALAVAGAYLGFYLLGRLIWVDPASSTFLGWLALARPSGAHSYLYGWLLSSGLFWYAMGISVLPSLFGKKWFSRTTLAGFLAGFVLGLLFGPNPAGDIYGHGHYGWAIWGGCFLLSMAGGILAQRLHKRQHAEKPPESGFGKDA